MSDNNSTSACQRLRLPPPLPRPRSARAWTVARWFGLRFPVLPTRTQPDVQIPCPSLLPEPAGILLITGPSGSGKSSLLRGVVHALPTPSVIDLKQLHLPDRPVVDCIDSMPMSRALRLLSRVGLAEAWTYLRTPDELSDGQRWRLRVAIGLSRIQRQPDSVLICDEFAALLDRVTAAVIAHALRRAITDSGGRAIVATSHDDLAPALAPDRLVQCDFGIVRIHPPVRHPRPGRPGGNAPSQEP